MSTDPSFATLGLQKSLVDALRRQSITTPTPVQRAVLPDAVAGRDVLGRAETGSGKTLAFGLPILARLAGSRSKPRSPRALVIVPTRELAGQVRTSLEPLAGAVGLRLATVYGGTPYDRQIKRLRAGVDIVVATPGRLTDLVERDACRLDRVEIVVLDEADHLCDLGFFPAVSALVAATPPGGQRLLLSATLDGDVDKLVNTHLDRPVVHDCVPESDGPDIDHHVLVTAPGSKIASAAELLRANPRSIVFTRTRHGATRLAGDLAKLGVTTVDLHGSLSQNARERNLRKFRTGQADVVVATDVAARGIHVDGVSLVVHYDAPNEHKAYTHRSGRTGRAGESGTVVTFATPAQVGSVGRLQKAAGVVARQHDVRTAPRPMTAASLAEAGTEVAVSSGHSRSSDRSSDRSGRARSSSARRSGRRPDSTRRDGRPSRNRSAGDRRGRGQAEAQSTGSGRPTRSERRSSKPGAGTGQPKARWTGAEKRAARDRRTAR